MINGKALRNMEVIPYTTQMMSSVKEPFRFKLNTESPSGFLYLSFLETNKISTLNTTCIIQQQLNSRKFIHHSDSMIQPIVNKKSTMKLKDC